MKYCPSCGSEYLAGFEECADCQVALVQDPPQMTTRQKVRPRVRDRAVVFRSGRRMDAELVRARLEADGIDTAIWSSGLGPWRLESALTEVTGVPSDFNSHQVVVDPADLEWALQLLAEPATEEAPEEAELPEEGPRTFLSALRQRWMLLALAIFLLLVVILAGPIGS